MSDLSRRSVLAAVGSIAGVSVAGGAAAFPVAHTYSAEFLEYRRSVQAHIDACDGTPEPAFGTPEYRANHVVRDAACEDRYQASLVIQSRPVMSWHDFVELALVVQGELWDRNSDGSWGRVGTREDLEATFQVAVSQMTAGGARG